MKLWHCYNTRSLRVLWTLEELRALEELRTLEELRSIEEHQTPEGLKASEAPQPSEKAADLTASKLDYELEILPFPPRVFRKEYLEINPLGTVPYFVDGETRMTESSAICHYLAEKYGNHAFGLPAKHPEYGQYLNWLYQSDATLAFPQTLVLRYGQLETADRRQPQVAEDYTKWFLARLRHLDQHLSDLQTKGQEYLCGNRFTVADIAVGYSLHLGQCIGLSDGYSPLISAYLSRLQSRPAFQRAQSIGKEMDAFG